MQPHSLLLLRFSWVKHVFPQLDQSVCAIPEPKTKIWSRPPQGYHVAIRYGDGGKHNANDTSLKQKHISTKEQWNIFEFKSKNFKEVYMSNLHVQHGLKHLAHLFYTPWSHLPLMEHAGAAACLSLTIWCLKGMMNYSKYQSSENNPMCTT